jgi:DNA-binding transcriptional regulator YiaG
MVIDNSKALFIKKHFKDKKLAIFYKFIAELEAIKEVLDITQDVNEFNTTDKHIALQIVSGREGINLSKADCLIYYNIDFSAVSYWQSRDRLTTKERLTNDVYWIFAKGGIEKQIYKAVLNKKDYTLNTFKKDERARLSEEN